MLRTVVLPPHPQPLSQRARGARKTFKVPRPQGEGFRERETPGFELDKVYSEVYAGIAATLIYSNFLEDQFLGHSFIRESALSRIFQTASTSTRAYFLGRQKIYNIEKDKGTQHNVPIPYID
jgi:hypothetical protein